MFDFRVYRKASECPIKFKGVVKFTWNQPGSTRSSNVFFLGNSLDALKYFNHNFPLTYYIAVILDALEV
jgi:hypothetical protein